MVYGIVILLQYIPLYYTDILVCTIEVPPYRYFGKSEKNLLLLGSTVALFAPSVAWPTCALCVKVIFNMSYRYRSTITCTYPGQQRGKQHRLIIMFLIIMFLLNMPKFNVSVGGAGDW